MPPTTIATLIFMATVFVATAMFGFFGTPPSKSLRNGIAVGVMAAISFVSYSSFTEQPKDTRHDCVINMTRIAATAPKNALPIDTKWGKVYVENNETVVKIGSEKFQVEKDSSSGRTVMRLGGKIVSEADKNGLVSVY